MRWNPQSGLPLVRSLQRVVRSRRELTWISSVSIDDEGYLWVASNRWGQQCYNCERSSSNNNQCMSSCSDNDIQAGESRATLRIDPSRFHDYFHGRLDPTNVNFRIFRARLPPSPKGSAARVRKDQEEIRPRPYYYRHLASSSATADCRRSANVIMLPLLLFSQIFLKRLCS